MKYIKMLGLAAVAAAALMAFVGAGTASATQLTGTGGAVLGVGTVIHAEAEGTVTLHPPIGAIECGTSTVEGTVSNAGGAAATVSGSIKTLTFGNCNATVTVLKPGSLEIHTEFETTGNPATSHQKAASTNNGTLTSSGAEVTVVFAGFHCIFSTNNTDLGTVTGSATTKSNATLDISANIPRTGGSSGVFCGSTAAWTGAYKVTKPNPLNIH